MSSHRLHSNARITAIGTYVPEKILTNLELEGMVDTNDEWIVQRTGIRERHISEPHQYTSDLCFHAVRNLRERYQVGLEDVDHVIVATSTPDTVFPSMAARVQGEFGIRAAGALDIQAACAGFVSGLQLANGLLLSGSCRKILVIGAETLSKITDYTDRSTCILFGDGAGAVLVEAGAEGSFIASRSATDGTIGHHLYRSALSDNIAGSPIATHGCIVQNGREVYKWAVTQVSEGITDLLHTSGTPAEQLDWLIPHSANLRILESISERTGIGMDRILESVVRYGNTSAASIPLALDSGIRAGRVKPGHSVLLYGFGGGLTQSGLLLQWVAESQ
ncbi:ketoacyl-ACP synthase III [Paenibacillus daejeonensis]|uniref:ketoacyl-ACP synthase III n=1 Tax=Paenibacillus daejeonensis TaxID=135193 RepID=UPI00035CB039|nr:ketoacyl-ACP synthase III [Paenibacillus daejeonensis]